MKIIKKEEEEGNERKGSEGGATQKEMMGENGEM